MRHGLLLGAVALGLGGGAMPARAAVFTWSVTGAFTGAGTLTTTDLPYVYDIAEQPAGQSVPGYLVTAMTGTFAGLAVSLVKADPEAAPYYASNLLYPTGEAPFIDDRGLLFRTRVRTYNLFSSETCGGDTGACSNIPRIGYPGIAGGSRQVTFTIKAVASAVPEASSWAMMIAGIGGIGAGLRSRRAKLRVRIG